MSMSRAATLSVMGLYEWDNSLFDLMLIPQQLNKDTLVMNLLAETAELEVLYPNPTVLKNLIGVWSHKQIDIWNKLFATTQFEYNPIENYNRYETGKTDGTATSTHSGTDSRTDSSTTGGTDTRTVEKSEGGRDSYNDESRKGGSDTVSGEKKSEHYVAGYDSAAAGDDDGLVKQNRDEDQSSATTEYGATDNSHGSVNYGKNEKEEERVNYGKNGTGTSDTTYGHKIETENSGGHELHAHGNIGVMSTQDMIAQEREIDKFNMYDIIINDFKMRFCILVY